MSIIELNEKAEAHVKDLIAVNVDTARGLRVAASELDDDTLQSTCLTLAEQREQFARELGTHVPVDDDEHARRGTLGGMVRRWWLNVRSFVEANDPAAVLAEAERSEDAIKAAYASAVRDTVGTPVHGTLMRQRHAIVAGHDLIRDLRDMYQAA